MKILRMGSVRGTFQIIQVLVALLLVFLVVQGVIQTMVGRKGVSAIGGLEREALPSLQHIAALEANQNLYRLRSYELMFVPENLRPAKAAQADALHQKQLEVLASLKTIFPNEAGAQHLLRLESCLKSYADLMLRLRAKLDKEFQVAMEMLDKDVPVQVQQLEEATKQFKAYCEAFAAARTQQTVTAFSDTKKTVLVLGSSSAGFAAAVLVLVAWSSRRIRRALTGVARRLTQDSDLTTRSASAVAASSQSLAEGASEQAASLEETSSSLEEMASMTRGNAESAEKANALATQARQAADHGTADMQSMSRAMEAIKASSADIAKIIKTIDEIAFQTNILALNAAVEAARAGEAGMSFAVVADEVRSLAQRSAQSAKETAAKIEDAIAKSEQGAQISAKVAGSLEEIVGKVRQVDELVAHVATASKEQTQGITQINAAVSQMDKITQSNAANAEESASASEELNAQAESMKEAVAELLRLVGGHGNDGAVPPPVPARHGVTARQELAPTLSTGVQGGHRGNGNGASSTRPSPQFGQTGASVFHRRDRTVIPENEIGDF